MWKSSCVNAILSFFFWMLLLFPFFSFLMSSFFGKWVVHRLNQSLWVNLERGRYKRCFFEGEMHNWVCTFPSLFAILILTCYVDLFFMGSSQFTFPIGLHFHSTMHTFFLTLHALKIATITLEHVLTKTLHRHVWQWFWDGRKIVLEMRCLFDFGN